MYLHLIATEKVYKTHDDLLSDKVMKAKGKCVLTSVEIGDVKEWSMTLIDKLGGNMVRAAIDKMYPEIEEEKLKQMEKESVAILTSRKKGRK